MRYIFKPAKGYVFTKYTVERLEKGETEISLDLGRSITKIEVERGNVILPNGSKIGLSHLREIVKRRDRAYFLEEGGEDIFEVSLSTPWRYYKLMVVAPDTAPTLEISGIHMHRIKNITPLEDTLEKVRLADIRRGHRVLDICTGLGYTAIYSLKRGASSIVTVEKDPYVLEIARYNPWSRELADEKIEIVLADASEYIEELNDESFDRVIHDPPRFALAGELYSLEFYEELYRVLKKKGVLFHYTGAPGVKKGLKFQAGVAARLKYAGFSRIKTIKDFAVIAYKTA